MFSFVAEIMFLLFKINQLTFFLIFLGIYILYKVRKRKLEKIFLNVLKAYKLDAMYMALYNKM